MWGLHAKALSVSCRYERLVLPLAVTTTLRAEISKDFQSGSSKADGGNLGDLNVEDI